MLGIERGQSLNCEIKIPIALFLLYSMAEITRFHMFKGENIDMHSPAHCHDTERNRLLKMRMKTNIRYGNACVCVMCDETRQ